MRGTYLYSACACLATIVFVVTVSSIVHPHQKPHPKQEAFHEVDPTYMHKRSSCYSCEKGFPPGEEWRGQPSKCFSCEADLAARGGDPFAASRTIS
jgi:hypothetical protein